MNNDDTNCIPEIDVQIPPFWAEEPALWFAHVEAQFALAGITNDVTKYFYIISSLEYQYAVEVEDIISNPLTENQYAKLKTELIRRLSALQEKKVKQRLTHEELGDRKPSQFLKHLRTLAGWAVPDDSLRMLWLGRLPHNIQTVIASQPSLALEVIAELADKVHEIAPSTPQVASTESHNLIKEMAKQIADLTQQIAALRLRCQKDDYRPRPRSRSRRTHDQRNRDRSKSRNTAYCWFHNRFGDKANKCTAPCSYKTASPGNASGSRK